MGDRPTRPAAVSKGKQDGAQSERQKRLAEALRANLRRRRQAQKPQAAPSEEDDPSGKD